MKKYLYHLRLSILFGLAIVLCYVSCLPRNFSSTSHSQSRINISQPLLNTIVDPNSPDDDLSSETPPVDNPSETWKPQADLIIRAINPGYTIDGIRDVGEFIELHRTIDTSLPLVGYSIRYTNSSGKSTELLRFSEGSTMAGESLLLRLARSPASDQSDATYMTTLAMSNGKLEIVYEDTAVDTVCWSTNDECALNFKSSSPTVLVRDLSSGLFEHHVDYSPSFDLSNPSLILPPLAPDDTVPEDGPPVTNNCRGLEFSEILTYYDKDKSEQFIELYNSSERAIDLNNCQIRYKNKLYALQGQILPDSYHAFYPQKSTPNFALTKDPKSSNTIEIVALNNEVIDILSYNHGQKKSTSYSRFYDAEGAELWQLTYSPTPGAANNYQEFRSCPVGKVINPATGNCIKTISTTDIKTDCPAGKYRNPLTGRCKNYEATSEPKPCAEGYERNPETNRCRKIKKSNEGAGYALVPTTYSNQSTFIALGVVIILVLIGAIYIILQFRHEIIRGLRKLRQRLHRLRKDLLAGQVRPHRHKKP